MCRQLICVFSFLLLLGLASGASAELVGHWTFDDGSGTTAADSSGNGNDAAFNGDPQWVEGFLGGALEFNGSGDWLDCGSDASVGITGAVSMAAWIKLGDTGIDQKIGGNQDNANGGYKMGMHNADKVEFEIRTSANSAVLNRDVAGGTVLQADVWYHVVGVYSQAGGYIRTYVDGVLDREMTTSQVLGASPGTLYLGCEPYNTGACNFNGVMDDVRLYNHALTDAEIRRLAGRPQAHDPIPADDAIYTTTWVSCQWQAGTDAASHDVYFSDSFADVDAGTPDAFRGNLPLDTSYFFAGLGLAGDPYPDGLVPGKTYYWRIDEVNDLHPDSPWKGKIWSFSIPSNKAREPIPADGARFIDPDVTLSWTPGLNAVSHHVYFGDNPDDVAAGTPDTDKVDGPMMSFVPGTLEREKTYYWRIDEADGPPDYEVHQGDVWSFTIAKEGGGLLGEYYHWSGDFPPPDAFQVFVLSRIDPQINWNWGDPGSPDPLVNENNFACRWTGEVEAGFTETYTFYMTTDDGQRLWIDGQLIIDYWIEHGMTEHSGTIDLVAGQRYSITAEHYENGGGAGAELRWSSEHTPKQIIPQAALSPPVRAGNPKPPDGATGVSQVTVLSWNPGIQASSHEVYFGTDPDALTKVATKALGDESYDPGKLAWDTTYYWRVDEVNNLHADSPWTGNVWSFSTGDFLVVDNFEDYGGDAVPLQEQIWYSWRDGLGYGAVGVPPYYPGNGTGSEVGDITTGSYTEETILHGGFQSMPYWYNNNKPDKLKYSEAKRTLPAGLRDWTEEGIKALSLWFRGYPASTASFAIAGNTYTMTGSGTDIWDVGPGDGEYGDEFHFAYKQVSGACTIIARVDSVQNTHDWAKAGVMIRETLEPGSKHAFVCITPVSGVAAQARPDVGAASIGTTQAGIAAPHWVRLDRDAAGNFTASHSTNGSTWEAVTGAVPQNIPMNTNFYIGLALTSHDAALTCEAVFSGVQITGNVTGQWMHQDIGIESNAAERMYVAIANNNGTTAVVPHKNPNATQIDDWTEWNIDLKDFQDQGINLADVNSIAVGFGDRNNPVASGAGKMYFDDIRLYRARYVPGLGTPLEADFNRDGVVDNLDLEIMSDNWLVSPEAPGTANLIAHYEFEDNVLDSAGTNHGIANGSPGYVPGTDGQAIDLDGVNDYVDCGSDASLNMTDAVTIATWIKLSGSAADQKIAGNQDGTTGGYKLGLNNNLVEFEIRTSDNAAALNRSVSGGTALTPNVWHHVTGVYSQGDYIRTYVDGRLDRELVTAEVLGSSTGPLMIGREPFSALYFFDGLIDDLRVYNSALSSSEIFSLAGAPLDLNGDTKVDFKDYAVLVDQWLEEQVWPEW